MNIRWTLQRERSSSQKDVVKCSTTFLKGSSFCGDFWELHIKIHNISHDTFFLNKNRSRKEINVYGVTEMIKYFEFLVLKVENIE